MPSQHETAEADREQARLELEALQAECPSAVVGVALKTTRVDADHAETSVWMTKVMPVADIQRLHALLQHVRPNPRYVKTPAVIPSYRVWYSNKFLLTIQGQEHELPAGDIREDNTYGEPKWLLDEVRVRELRSLLFKYSPKCPKPIR
ncbi:MAG: hypothetical protein ACI4OS_00085 [Akkermansia sp.]